MVININDVAERELIPGGFARLVHGDKMTLAHWRLEEGAILPAH